MFAVKPYYLSSSGTLDYTEGYIISRPQAGVFQVEVPLASSIESTMEWCNRVAAKHSWSDINNPICDISGFNWLHYDGNRQLNRVVPNANYPYQITGDNILGSGFYTRYRDIIKFMGDNTLQDWGSPSGNHWPSMDIASNQWTNIQELNLQPKITREHYHKYIYRGVRNEPTFFGGFFNKSFTVTRFSPTSPVSNDINIGWYNPLNSIMTVISGVLDSIWYGDGYVFGGIPVWRNLSMGTNGGNQGDNPPQYTGPISIFADGSVSLQSINLGVVGPRSIGFSDYKWSDPGTYRFYNVQDPGGTIIPGSGGKPFYTSAYQELLETCFAAAFYPVDTRQDDINRTLKHLLGLDKLGLTVFVSGYFTAGNSGSFDTGISFHNDIDLTSDWYGNYKLVYGSIYSPSGRCVKQGQVTYNPGTDATEASFIANQAARKIRTGQYHTIANFSIGQPNGSGNFYYLDSGGIPNISPYVSSGLIINASSTYMDVYTPGDDTIFFALFGEPFEGSGLLDANMRTVWPALTPEFIAINSGSLRFNDYFTGTMKSNIAGTSYKAIYPTGEIISLGYPMTGQNNVWGTLEHHSEWW